jgi:hypothetical protein
MAQVCRLCNKPAYETQAVQVRVNELGVPGIWECRPICGAQLDHDDAVIAAIEGTFEKEDNHDR